MYMEMGKQAVINWAIIKDEKYIYADIKKKWEKLYSDANHPEIMNGSQSF